MRAARIAVVVVMGLLAAWFLFDGISNLLAFPQQLEAFGVADRAPWGVLWASVLAPPLIFAAAVVLGWRQPVTRFTLVLIVALEWSGRSPQRLPGRAWGLAAGVLSGVVGGAVGTPGPPAIVYMAAQGWSARTIKANLQAFLVVNQLVILVGYWWAGLLTSEVWRLAAVFTLPALVGLLAGMHLFGRLDPVRFRRIVFAILLASGVALLLRG